jgi:nitrogenase molybdenum-cofactor synthesis protein NifE
VKQTYQLTNCRNSGAPYKAVLTTNISEKNIVYGGENELTGAIQEIDHKYRPDLLIVATSCATGIIGDNVDTIVEKAQKRVSARLLPIHCEGFAGEYRSGFDLVFGKFVELMKPPTDESRAALKKSVNIVGGKMGPERTEVDTDEKELVRLMKGIGANVNAVIAAGCTLEQLQNAPSVAVNCGLCYDIGYALGKEMERSFGTPMNSTILPYGIAATKKWLLTAAKYLDLEKEAVALCAQEYEVIREKYEAARANLVGKIGIIEGKDAVKSLSIAHMLERDFGMRAVIYNFHPWSAEARVTSIDYLLEAGTDPEILITKGALAFGRYESMKQSEDELLEYLGGIPPGSAVYFGSSISFPSIPLVDLNAILNRPRFGYRGALKVAECIGKSFDYAHRPRSSLAQRMVFPKGAGGIAGASNLGLKMSQSMPDCTFYGQGRRRQCIND